MSHETWGARISHSHSIAHKVAHSWVYGPRNISFNELMFVIRHIFGQVQRINSWE